MELTYFTADSGETSAETSVGDSSQSAVGFGQTGGLLKGMGIVLVMMIVLLPLLIFMDKKSRKHREELMLIEEMSKKEDSGESSDE